MRPVVVAVVCGWLCAFVVALAPARADADARLERERAIALPGRGIAVAWSPDGTRIAAGGHFRGGTVALEQTKGNLRYDTKVYDADSGALLKSFDCHGFWVVSTAGGVRVALENNFDVAGPDTSVIVWRRRW